ncbi:MAG: HAD hydrolase-like protein [Nanoarchaeota archaeon]|nr:HAD hydrolase-like protein [Nanoarchaeota archaeon]
MKAVIFDFDGVIHDTFELAYGIHESINSGFSREKFRSNFEGNIFEFIDKKPNHEIRDKFRELESEAFKSLRIEHEIRLELEELSKKFDLYIISSNTTQNLATYFENNNFVGIFKEILAAETHKSKVEKFKLLFKKYGLDVGSCIFVTDTLGDILEGNKVGIKSIACTFGYHDEARLKKGNPFKIVSNFREIRKVIDSI